MDHEIQKLHDQVNQAIIRCRRVYSVWAKKNKVSYNRMLVLYTIREYGSCTQKQVCDSYMLPRQTVNHVITEMRKEGILAVSEEMSRGEEYSERLLHSLSLMEERAAAQLGAERIRMMTELFMEYDRVLEDALEEEE